MKINRLTTAERFHYSLELFNVRRAKSHVNDGEMLVQRNLIEIRIDVNEILGVDKLCRESET